MALNELKMGAFSFSRRAVFKNVSKRKNPIFLRFSSAKTMNFSLNPKNLKNRTCLTHVFFAIFGIFFYKEKIWRKNFFIRKNSNFRHIFENSRKLMKYTCFRNFRKIAILRGSKLSRYSIFFRSETCIEKISTYIFICQNFIPIRSIVFELWASQNRHFSTFSKTRVFYHFWEFSKIWRKWPFFLIKIRKERKNPDFRHILDQNPIFWVNTPQKFEKIEFLKMAFVCQIEPSNGQIGDF